MNVAQQDVYANNLRQNLGYPLRRPNSSSPEGLRIGDVGHVDKSGTFHVLCNIRSPSRSDQFQAIPLDENLIFTDATAVLQHPLFTGVNRDISQESDVYQFTATAERGAILILPSGAKLYDLQDQQKLDEFQDLAIKHAHRWCLSAGHNSLYLITGLYRTRSWTLGSFYGRRDVDGKKILVQKSVEEDDDLAAYKWQSEFPNLDPQSCRKNTKSENQTVLIKGFKMKVRPKLGVTVVEPVQGSRNCFASLLEYLKYLASQFGVIVPPITRIKPYPELSRQPHYLDIVNNYLLENSDADVVITHDDVWIKMLEKSKSMAIQESELLERVKGEYIPYSGNNAICLQRRLSHITSEDSNGVLVQETVSSESRVVITHICAENVTVGLGYVPVAFFVRVEIDGGISRRTENKPALVDDHNIQWNDWIYLPSASSTKVRLVLCASFEFSPVLGSGEPVGTLEIHVSDLLERTRPFTIKESIPRPLSLLVSAQQWYGNHWMSGHVDDSDRKERSTLPDITSLTDEGHRALLGYYRNHNEKDLESSVTLFTQALKKCPVDDPCHVVALSNLAKAQFLSDQFHRAHQNFHDSTSRFEEALRLRAGDHPDRPMTLLYLSQALLYYRASGLQVLQSTLHKHINELETICPRDTHARRAADLVLQTYELSQLQISDDWRKLDELIPKWIRAADELPEVYFDKPVRFDIIGLALHRRFQLCHDATDLKRAVKWFEKAVQITPDGHTQKSTYADHLSDVRLYQWATVALTNSSVNEALDAAAKSNDVPKSYIYRAICDVLEGSNRVLEAIECFRKMQDELLEMHTPVLLWITSERATWEVDFQRRCVNCVKKIEELGDISMERRDLNIAMECYLTALSFDPRSPTELLVERRQRCVKKIEELGDISMECGDLNIAMECYFTALSFDPRSPTELLVKRRQRYVKKIEELGNISMTRRDLNIAIECYSTALSFDPTPIELLVKRSKAYIAKGLWKDALNDANKVISLDESSPWGYERKHAALHQGRDYDNAIDAFEAMLLKMSQSADANIRNCFQQYVDPGETRKTIRETVQNAIRNSPRVLINTFSGRLYDKTEQAAAFESLPVFKELISSMTTSIDHERIKQSVTEYYRYAMFSHRWEENEPLFEKIMQILVHNLEKSPTHDKLQMFCKIVQDAGFSWAWSDTCCIDKSNHVVLQEALVSMFRWYEDAALTIIYLLGVQSPSQPGDLVNSIWNTRAWTFQEYHASKVVRFYTQDWKLYLNLDIPNHKESLEIISEMEKATGVSAKTLKAIRPGLGDIREKLCLASVRKTTLIEDAAYSLLGIFSVSLPVVYGEGDKALGRLLAQLLTNSGDTSILAWTGKSGNFNSCLPANIAVFDEFPAKHIPVAIKGTEMEVTIAGLRSSPLNLSLVMKLQEQLHKLPLASCSGQRMKLPCLTFRLGPVASQSSEWHTFRAKAVGLGVVVIKTTENLLRLDSLILVHPWIDFLLDRQHIGSRTDALSDQDSISQFSAITSSTTYSNETPSPSSSNTQTSASRFVRIARRLPSRATTLMLPAVESPPERQMKALRVIARLRQPFGALLFARTRRNVEEYRRVAADSMIMVQIQEDTPLNDLIDGARMLDVL